MKKILIIVVLTFVITGCSNSISIDFNNNIDTKIEFSFSSDEYNNYIKDNTIDIDAIISESRPLDNSYDELFEQKKYKNDNNNYEGEFTYSYTYDNFKDNLLLKRCFEYPIIEEEKDKILVYLKGESSCAPFVLKIKANNRMINNNSTKIIDNTYMWNVKEKNNDIRFNISKYELEKKSIRFSDILYIIVTLLIVIFLVLKNKKIKS